MLLQTIDKTNFVNQKLEFSENEYFSVFNLFTAQDCTHILRIGDQVLTFDVFWPKHLHEVRSTVCIHVQPIKQM